MTDEERKAWEELVEACSRPLTRDSYPNRFHPIVLAADAELIALLSRVAVLEKENKILETIARGCLGTQFAETYLTELRRRAKEG